MTTKKKANVTSEIRFYTNSSPFSNTNKWTKKQFVCRKSSKLNSPFRQKTASLSNSQILFVCSLLLAPALTTEPLIFLTRTTFICLSNFMRMYLCVSSYIFFLLPPKKLYVKHEWHLKCVCWALNNRKMLYNQQQKKIMQMRSLTFPSFDLISKSIHFFPIFITRTQFYHHIESTESERKTNEQQQKKK